VKTGDSRTAVAREQLCRHVVSPAKREHAIMEDTFSVRSVPGLYNEDFDRSIGQGEARHRKYKRLKLGGREPYDRSSD
jgi:hypothetical protein